MPPTTSGGQGAQDNGDGDHVYEPGWLAIKPVEHLAGSGTRNIVTFFNAVTV
jgi:hypothetical protein